MLGPRKLFRIRCMFRHWRVPYWRFYCTADSVLLKHNDCCILVSDRRRLEGSDNKCAKCCLKCCICCLWCLEKILKYINQNAYTIIGELAARLHHHRWARSVQSTCTRTYCTWTFTSTCTSTDNCASHVATFLMLSVFSHQRQKLLSSLQRGEQLFSCAYFWLNVHKFRLK